MHYRYFITLLVGDRRLGDQPEAHPRNVSGFLPNCRSKRHYLPRTGKPRKSPTKNQAAKRPRAGSRGFMEPWRLRPISLPTSDLCNASVAELNLSTRAPYRNVLYLQPPYQRPEH